MNVRWYNFKEGNVRNTIFLLIIFEFYNLCRNLHFNLLFKKENGKLGQNLIF